MTAQPSIESFFNEFEDALSDVVDVGAGATATSTTPESTLRHWASLETLSRKRTFMTSQRSRSACDFYSAPEAGSRRPEADPFNG